MNRFLTTIGLALVTLAAIWGGFWLTNRSGQTGENLSLPAVQENMTEGMQRVKTATAEGVDKSKAMMDTAAQKIAAQTREMSEKTEKLVQHSKDVATQMKETTQQIADVQQKVEAVKQSAANVASKVTQIGRPNAGENVLAKEAEALGMSHEQAMLLPNLGSGWHVVAKLAKPNTVKLKEVKTGTDYIAVSERTGNIKRTILMNAQTGEKVREFTANIQ